MPAFAAATLRGLLGQLIDDQTRRALAGVIEDEADVGELAA